MIEEPAELRDQTRLPDARLARDEHGRASAPPSGLLEHRVEGGKLGLAPEEARRIGVHRIRARPCHCLEHLPHRHRFGFPLQADRIEFFVVEQLARQCVRRRTDRYPVRRRGGLQARRRVDGVSGQEALAGARRRVEMRDGLARVDADADVDGRSVGATDAGDVAPYAQRRVDRPLRVVLVGGGHAEHGHDRIADVLLDDAAVDLDRMLGHAVVLAKHAVDVLRVGAFGERRETHHVAEQAGDDPAFDDRAMTVGCECGAAGGAKPGVVGQWRTASGAGADSADLEVPSASRPAGTSPTIVTPLPHRQPAVSARMVVPQTRAEE